MLSSGLGFLIFTGFCLFFLSKASKSNLSDKSKKSPNATDSAHNNDVLHFIFENYTADYIARSSVSIIK